MVRALYQSFRLYALLLIASLMVACATQSYAPRPIQPEQQAEQFSQRSLQAPALQRYLEAQGGIPADAFPLQQWGLLELTLAAYFYHPQLAVARAQWQAAQAAEITAGQRPNPGVSGYGEHHSQTDGGISPWTYGISFAIPIETHGKREARMAQAAQLSEAARIEIGQNAWQVRSRLRDSLLDVLSIQSKIALLEREIRLQEEVAQMLEARLDAGLASTVEVKNARLQLQRSRNAIALEQGRVPVLRSALANAIGIPVQALQGIRLDDAILQRALKGEQLQSGAMRGSALLNRLDIRAALARYAATEARLQLEIARQYPDIVLEPGYAWDQGDRQWTLGLSMILMLLHKNEGPIAEARAQRELQAQQFNALQTRVIGEVELSLAGYRAFQEQVQKAQRLEQAQREQLRQIEHQFDAGQADRLQRSAAQMELVLVELGILDTQLQSQRALNALEDAVQQPLDDAAALVESAQETPRNE